MRLFVAVELPAEVTAAASRLIARLRERCDMSAPRARISWAVPGRMHLTLQFIGEADLSRTEAIQRALAPPFDLPPFEIALGGTGVFPEPHRPRVIWVGLTAGRAPLTELQQQVAARLVRAGVEADDRPFRPHLTLGRVREAAGLRTSSVLEGLAEAAVGRVPVVEAVLFESRATADGQVYVARQRTRLGDGKVER
jgi:2'-5' RNA ligase